MKIDIGVRPAATNRYKEIAAMAKELAALPTTDPKFGASVKVDPEGQDPKAVSTKLRAGLAGLKQGRFSVIVGDDKLVYVEVNVATPRKRPGKARPIVTAARAVAPTAGAAK